MNNDKDEQKETKTKNKRVSYIDLNSLLLEDEFISAAQERHHGISQTLKILYPKFFS